MDAPYTKKRHAQYRGPTTSDDYNERIEENYRDLMLLHNRARMTEVQAEEFYRRLAKEHYTALQMIEDLENRLRILEEAVEGQGTLTFYSHEQIDVDRFNLHELLAVGETERLSVDRLHGILTLPKVDTSSMSKLFFSNQEGEEVVPPSLQMRVVGIPGTADTPEAYIEESPPESSLYSMPGVVWERNVVVEAPSDQGAGMVFYVAVPSDLFTTENSNAILIHPFPALGTSVVELSYTTKTNPLLEDDDGYTPINSSGHYAGEPRAVGWVAPGGWKGEWIEGDQAQNMGPRMYYFPPRPITAIRVRIFQDDYYKETGRYIYTYGLTLLDLRYDKFLGQGKTVIRFDAPEGSTINSIEDVRPEIWNVSPNMVDEVFDYRVIWETAYDSQEYVVDVPQPNSIRVWIELTLKNTDGWTPAVSGMTVDWA